MARQIRIPLLILLFALAGLFVVIPSTASADPPDRGTCYPNSPGHFVYDYPIYGSSECIPNHETCRIGWQTCEWDCVSDSDGSGNTHPENVVCYQPDICNPQCPVCC